MSTTTIIILALSALLAILIIWDLVGGDIDK